MFNKILFTVLNILDYLLLSSFFISDILIIVILVEIGWNLWIWDIRQTYILFFTNYCL